MGTQKQCGNVLGCQHGGESHRGDKVGCGSAAIEAEGVPTSTRHPRAAGRSTQYQGEIVIAHEPGPLPLLPAIGSQTTSPNVKPMVNTSRNLGRGEETNLLLHQAASESRHS